MTSKLNIKQSLVAGLSAASASAVINAALFLVFHAAGVITDRINIKPNQPLTIVPVIMGSVVPAIVGSLVFFIIEKFSKRGYRIFAIISVTLVVLSLYSPFAAIPGVTTAYALVLCAMHLVVAASLLYFIYRAKQTKHENIHYQPA